MALIAAFNDLISSPLLYFLIYLHSSWPDIPNFSIEELHLAYRLNAIGTCSYIIQWTYTLYLFSFNSPWVGLHYDASFKYQRWSDGKFRGDFQNFPADFDESVMNAEGVCAYVEQNGEWGAASCDELRPVVCEASKIKTFLTIKFFDRGIVV